MVVPPLLEPKCKNHGSWSEVRLVDRFGRWHVRSIGPTPLAATQRMLHFVESAIQEQTPAAGDPT